MSDMAKMESVLSEHAVTLGVLVKSVNNIEGFMKESVESQMRQEVLMEKLANFEANTKTSFDRVHARIDSTNSRIERLEADIDIREHRVKKSIEHIEPKAIKGETIHSGLIWTAKTLGGIIIAMLFGLMIWAIKASDYTTQG